MRRWSTSTCQQLPAPWFRCALTVFFCATTSGAQSGDALSQDRSDAPVESANGSVTLSDDVVTFDDTGTLDLHVAEMPLTTMFRLLSLRGQRNIIATPAAAQGSVTANLHHVTFEKALRAALIPNGCDFVLRDDVYYVYTSSELAALRMQGAPMTHQIFRLNYVRPQDIAPIIELALSDQGEIAMSPAARVGIAANAGTAGGDALAGDNIIAVRDYPERLAAIAADIKRLDVKPLQVLVEATILRIRLSEENALGVDFSLLGGVDLQLLGATSMGVQNLALGLLPAERFEKFNSNVSTNFTRNVVNGGLTVGIIKDHVAIFIRALEQITDASVIANPKILALNKQIGNVIVGRRDGYITTTVTETQAIQKVEFLETGTQLTFRPFIGTDGYVRMEIHPEDSVGGLTDAQLPFEQTTEVTTNVLIKDGHTILIGGLFREVDNSERSQVPLLGDAPLIGALFRSRSDSIDREEVVILLTVTIIKNDDDYARQGAETLEDVERSRVGLRQGMMWHGRQGLAQSYYRKATEFFARGDSERALWHVQMAINNNPKFLSAVKLKEEIKQAREWDDTGSITRGFIWDVIQGQGGGHRPKFERPAPAMLQDAEPGTTQEE